MELAITILCAGVGSGAFLVSCAYAHRIVSETLMKRRALELTLTDDDNPEEEDELRKRLDHFRKARFSPPLQSSSRRPYRSE